jgi:hypothetical protein
MCAHHASDANGTIAIRHIQRSRRLTVQIPNGKDFHVRQYVGVRRRCQSRVDVLLLVRRRHGSDDRQWCGRL